MYTGFGVVTGILPVGSDSTLTTAFIGQVGADIGIVLGIVAVMFAIKWVLHRFNKSLHGKL